jgi:phosphotriesterase-related protein
MKDINTVTGPVMPDMLGATLMHEHMFVQYGGPSPEYCRPSRRRDEAVADCLDYIAQIRAYGVQTIVDPTTVDLGRNALLMAEVAARTDFNIICCTGIYSTATYVRLRDRLGGSPDAIADLFIKELTDGIDDTGVKAGFIKVVSTAPVIRPDEHELLLAAAQASVTTGAPIITHTDGVLGDEQQRIFTAAGVPARSIIIGHSCSSTSFAYLHGIVRAGSYLGFDQIGMETVLPDEVRVESMLKLIHAGWASRIMISHDSVWHWVGGPRMGAGLHKNWKPTNFFERIVPMLQYGGVTDEHIRTMLLDSPRRFFEGQEAGSPATVDHEVF